MKILNKLKIVLVSIFMILAITEVSGQRKLTALKYHKQLQDYNNYERWKKDQPKKRVEVAKFEVEVSRERKKEKKDKEELAKKIDKIRGKIEDN